MDHKREQEKLRETSSGHSSPRGQEAYYSLNNKRPKNVMKGWAVLGMIVMALAGAGYIASKNMVTDPDRAEVSKQLELKKELITSVLALQDDDYDAKGEKLAGQIDDHQTHAFSGPKEQERNHGHGSANQTDTQSPSQITDPEAAPVVDAAPASEKDLLNAEEDLRATEEAQRNKLAADSAAMQTLSDEAVAREARAEEAIRKHKEAHLKLLQQYQNQSIKVGGPVYEVPVQAQLGLYRGILSKCYIHGHDVHWIDDQGSIIDHVQLDTPLPGSAAVARNMIKEMGGGVAVIVYEKGYEVYSATGELIKAETFKSSGF